MESIFLDTDFSKCILESIYRSGSIEVRKLTSKISEIPKFSKSFQIYLFWKVLRNVTQNRQKRLKMYRNDLRDLSAGLGAWFPPALGKLKRAFCSSSILKFLWFHLQFSTWFLKRRFSQVWRKGSKYFSWRCVFAPVMTRALKRSGKIDRTELCRFSAAQLEKKGSSQIGAAAATDPAIGPRHPRQIVVISAISVAAWESSNDCRISFTRAHQQLITELLYSL